MTRQFRALGLSALALVCMGQAASTSPSPAEQNLKSVRPLPQTDDPRTDGWDTEVFSRLASEQLKRLGKLLLEPSKTPEELLGPLTAPDFACEDLRPRKLEQVFKDSAITVERWAGPSNATQDAQTHHGTEGLARAITDLVAPFNDATEVRFEIKVFRVDKDQAGDATTQQYITISGRLTGGSLEQHAAWQCHWTEGSDSRPPRLRSIEVTEYEQTQVRSADQVMFSDCTKAVLGQSKHFQPQLMRGVFDWTGHIQYLLGVDNGAFQGPAIGDINQDGLDDVYICQVGGLPNRLFLQKPDGTVTDRSTMAGVDFSDLTRCALIADLDNDGDQDLVLGTAPGILIMLNNGDGLFSSSTLLNNVPRAHGLAASDYDLDGDLDLYASCYDEIRPVLRKVPNPIPYHDANNGSANFLLQNNGRGRFTDVTKQTGMDQDNQRWTLAATWDDYDNDGDPDLYVANDFGRNCLYRNEGGKFVNVAAQAGVEDMASGMSTCWGDFNRDGWMDMYVANMWSAAGGRITFQPQFQPGYERSTKALVQRLTRGNSLFANNGDGTFSDVSVDAGVTMGRWAWGSIFVDFNNDGWEDLVVANGFMTAPDTDDL